ncbi:unnamed protein product [Blepharisma stoltei]|uniref:Uncharacterized protein n=1 Tax=Blepharisma stoltei TaxID=1481888 RepID=A0AAU9JW20_9CILI|nr:unnamed protein product [Blepharisma stoltei]
MQFGIQYLLYSQSHLKTWTEEMVKSAEHEKKQNTAMRAAIKKQKSKIKKLKQEIEDIDLKGMHYDLLTDALKPQNAPLEFKKIEETKVPTDEPAYLAKIKEHLKASAKLLKPDDELLDSDFELSMSVAERKTIPEKVHREQPEIIKEEAEYENIRSNRFNNPSTFGI